MKENKYTYNSEFKLESGKILPGIDIAYHTAGELNFRKNNVIWICHALTANSDPSDWWSDIVGKGKLYDPDEYFIVCANILGSCYGSTGATSINQDTDKPYYRSFPIVNVRDIIKAHNLLRIELGIENIHTAIGGSVGGHQALEWSIINSELIKHTILIATNAKFSPWGIALNESQRMAIEADSTFFDDIPEGGSNGLKAARSIALLSYRNLKTYNLTQFEDDENKTDDFKASSYQRYQGEKLIKRFNAYSYYFLTKTLDTHNIGRKRGGIKNALSCIKSKTLVVSIDSDILFPPKEQRFIAKYINGSIYKKICSKYGHDGFLIESKKITEIINKFYLNGYGK